VFLFGFCNLNFVTSILSDYAIIYFEYILVLKVAKPNCSFTQFERSLIIIINITIVIVISSDETGY